ncbi:MAG: alginate lyase family protein [Acidobacteria bacterium]|nr:alginate lyase family protein [Acidobacteriota bacterium]
MRQLFEMVYGKERADTLRHAADARDQRFEFFGYSFHVDGEIDWQADPVTGARWPSVFHADVPVHGGDLGYGDVKHVWELSRQQYLIDLAKAYFLARESGDLAAVRRLVRSWIAGNPYATGVNWSCALEPAFRAWSWLWAYHLISPDLDEVFHLEWLCGFYDHGRFLARHLEHYSSPYNHLIGEASALYAIALSFPEFADSDAWRAQAQAVLETRLREQFYTDGGSVEQSTFYHHATVGFYLLSGLLARQNGRDLSPDVWKAVERGIDFSMDLMQPDGSTPQIGGADDGKPIRMEHLPFWDFRAYQAVGAVVFGRADFKATAGRFHEDALWLLGPSGFEQFSGLESRSPSRTAVLRQASGYAVDRADWSSHADYVCFDVGEQAAGMRQDAVPNSMHGHADCLSIVAWLGGRRVLVDSGLYAYNCGGPWEAHFRETAAHNTARVDGRDQARHIGKMAWSHSYRVRIEDHVADGSQSWTVASHDGYARGTEAVTHRRAVWRRPGSYLLVYDEFVGGGEHELEVNFQFAPGTLEMFDSNHAVFEGFAEIAWVSDVEWTAQSRCGGPEPQDGWICSSLGVREEAPRVTLRAQTKAPRTSLLTVLAECAHESPRVTCVREEGSTLVAVTVDSCTDWVAGAGIATGGRIDTDGLLAVCRAAPGAELQQTRVGGSYLRANVGALNQLSQSLRPPVRQR